MQQENESNKTKIDIQFKYLAGVRLSEYLILEPLLSYLQHIILIQSPSMIVVDTIITVLPLIGYYSQYNLIKGRKAVGSFSIDLCGILLVANILRIFFWFSCGYAVNLFLQSFLIISMHLMLLKLCVELGYKKLGENNGIWRWDTFDRFVFSLLSFAFVFGFLTFIFIYEQLEIYGQLLGFLSLSIEATIGFPQLLSNQVSRSVEGLSIFMIATWVFGDLFKTVYFVLQDQPYQFIASGFIQLVVDILIVIQIMAFKGKNKTQSVKIIDLAIQVDHMIPAQRVDPFQGL